MSIRQNRPCGRKLGSPEQLAGTLAELVMGWGVAPDRFLVGNGSWMPRWRFQPTKDLEDAFRLLDAADPEECIIHMRRGSTWVVQVRIGADLGDAQDACKPRAITIAVARALGLEVSACD
jgi:hypothetical protein